MRVWRISNHIDLSGQGGLLSEGRWNSKGIPVVYCSDHPATCLLEMLVRIERADVPPSFRLLSIEVPNDAPSLRLAESELAEGWRANFAYTQSRGTQLLGDAEHLTITVPCVIVPFAWNVLLNPEHHAISRCSIVDVIESSFDPRLIR